MNKCVVIGLLVLFIGRVSDAQKTDTLVKKLDSLKQTHTDSASGKKFNVSATAYNEHTKITPRVYLILLGTDFTQEVTGPFHSTKKTWGKVAGFAVIESGLFLSDKPVQQYAIDLMSRNPNLKGVSHYVTQFGAAYEIYTLAALGTYGWVFKNEKMKTTTLLATQSYLVAGTVQALTKFVTGRQRPNYIATEADPRPIFRGPAFSLEHGSTSFPSGHTTAVFAAATVFAQEYKDHLWVPILSYSAATLVGLSRITENAHWISDVFAGAGLGYVTGLQVVRNYHRYAFLKNHKTPVARISWDVQYNYDHIEPALVFSFR